MKSTDFPDPSKLPKRKRLTQACDTCRKKKVKCDGNRPSCSNCIRLKVPCTYLPTAKKRGPRQGQTEKAEHSTNTGSPGFMNQAQMSSPLQPFGLRPATSLGNLPRYMDNVSASPDPTRNMYLSQSPQVNIPQYQGSRENFSPAYSYQNSQLNTPNMNFSPNNGLQEEENAVREKVEQVWSHSYLGNTSGLNAITSNGQKEATPSPKQFSNANNLLGATSLPPTEITEHLLSVYFSTIHPQMPFIHKPTFFNRLKNGEIPPILILSICACVSRFSNHPGILADPTTRSGEVFSNRFRNILLKCLDGPNVYTTMALLIASYYEYMNARYPRAWMYLGMAIRMAQELGINRIDEHNDNSRISEQAPDDWVEIETQRRLWWSCFVRDRIGSTGTGRPMAIDEQDSRVLLPSCDSDWENERPVPSTMLETSSQTKTVYSLTASAPKQQLSPWSIFIQLAALMGKVSQFVNSPKDRRGDSIENDTKFAFLDTALTSWSMSAPENLQYPRNLISEKSPKGYAEAAFLCTLHIMYHTSVILLHRSNLDQVENQPIYSTSTSSASESLDRCIASADTITKIIEDLDKYPACYNYPHICFCIFNGGTIHAHTLFSSSEADKIAEAKSKLEIHYQALQRLKSVWIMAEKYCAILKGIVALGQRPASVSPNTNSLVQELSQNAAQVGFNFEQPIYHFSGSLASNGVHGQEFGGVSSAGYPISSNYISSGLQMIPDFNSPSIRIADSSIDSSAGFPNLLDLPIAQGNAFFDTLFGNMPVDSLNPDPNCNLFSNLYNQPASQPGNTMLNGLNNLQDNNGVQNVWSIKSPST
ncbi:hypothetical protein K493DRAFT_261780 [Basidiobolus meristosporus CBS 931.73]|uniref:Zn(2)-C6 fungal-type domain-containing protein n=1 Tax=Basidiobolus meristosporus CBS 931.73 TaxID=1314790 RepID=A0A1Y1Y895_9FUNG|nr:hypothetical protein K493DRAFT_261780 [Basidiobolus meristosporus CBS 931.73]|eukprot:ORX94095.1 hypothetical protein K493DRAFT_261780 [Basidiobolus meristosporus CBS 931.73]